MTHTAKVRVGEKKGRTTVLICGECSLETVHEIMVFVDSEDESDDGDIRVWDSYLTVQCRGCRTVSFCVESSCTEDFDPEDPDALLVRKTLFPSRIVGRTPLRDLQHLSHELSKVYEETREALIQNLAVLAGIGIRAIVETVCNEKRAPGRNLSKKIDGLVSLRLITNAEAKIL